MMDGISWFVFFFFLFEVDCKCSSRVPSGLGDHQAGSKQRRHLLWSQNEPAAENWIPAETAASGAEERNWAQERLGAPDVVQCFRRRDVCFYLRFHLCAFSRRFCKPFTPGEEDRAEMIMTCCSSYILSLTLVKIKQPNKKINPAVVSSVKGWWAFYILILK